MGGDAVQLTEANTEAPNGSAPRSHGVEEQGMHALGFPRNLGGPAISTDKSRMGVRNTNSLAATPVPGVEMEQRKALGMVLPIEGNEERQDGWQGIGGFHST